MDNKKKEQFSLSNEDIRISENVNSITDVLKNAKPYMEIAVKKINDDNSDSSNNIEVPSKLFRDLVMFAASDFKRSFGLLGGNLAIGPNPKVDSNDDDWNPLKSGGMNFPDLD